MWLSELQPERFRDLFARLAEIEARMELPGWNRQTDGMTVEQAGVLARSPLYPQWRREVETVFGEIESGVAQSQPARRIKLLIVCVLPERVPLESQPLWPDLAARGAWVDIEQPFGSGISA